MFFFIDEKIVLVFEIWGWVKTLVPSEPQVIAGIYGCSSH